jgi:hypothetical protein
MKDIFYAPILSTPARAIDDEEKDVSRGFITPDESRVDNSCRLPSSPPPLLSVAHLPSSPGTPVDLVPPTPSSPVPEVEKRRYFAPSIDLEKNKKRRKTAMSIDGRNVILPLETLVKFLDGNFVCKRCHKSLQANDIDEPLRLEVWGVACGINFQCGCGVGNSLRPELVPSAHEKIKTLKDGQPYGTRVNTGDFVLNRRLMLGLQLCGDGRQEGKILAGMLNLNVNPMKQRWTEVQEILGKVVIQIGVEVLAENLHIECLLSPVGVDGRHALDIASDTRWDKRGSSRRYDSLSGCSVAFGLRSDLPVGIEVMSMVCLKCKKGHQHEAAVCPMNYDGSSKGMEAAGAAKIVCRMFANEEDKCCISHLVTDDDSSVRKILTHSYQEMIEATLITINDWPRYSNGQKKPDNGLLPLDHQPITFLADKGHRTRGYARVLFAEAAKSKKNGCGCTKLDAERMKRRMSWTLRLHSNGTYTEFRKAVLAVLEHHFDNHQHCADWCQAASGTAEEIRDSGLRFRSKERNKELYLFLKSHHEQFMEETKLRQLYHQYDTNMVEGFNKFLTKFLPKDKTYCKTIENKARSMLAVGLQSIGYRQLYRRVFELTGIPIELDDITSLFLRDEDADKLWRKVHRRKEGIKIIRMREQYRRLREGVDKLKADNARALGYQPGMMGPGGNEGDPQCKKQRRACKHCGFMSHSRISSRKCPKNINYKEPVGLTESVVGTGEFSQSSHFVQFEVRMRAASVLIGSRRQSYAFQMARVRLRSPMYYF